MRIRDEEKVEERKKKILAIAKDILISDGIEGLSIRKIANIMQQTPGIIYHYFENKDALLETIVQEGYLHIVEIIREHDDPSLHADQKLQNTLQGYVTGMLKQPYMYSIMMHSQHPRIQQQTTVLTKDICKRHETMRRLQACLQQGIEEKIFYCKHTEQRSQMIWCALFGFIDRVIKEKTDEAQVAILLEELIHMILQSLKGKET